MWPRYETRASKYPSIPLCIMKSRKCICREADKNLIILCNVTLLSGGCCNANLSVQTLSPEPLHSSPKYRIIQMNDHYPLLLLLLHTPHCEMLFVSLRLVSPRLINTLQSPPEVDNWTLYLSRVSSRYLSRCISAT